MVLSGEDVVQPDIMYISHERAHIVTDINIKGAPDLVVEILSPATAERERTIKKKLYARHGVCEMWLVNPGAQTVEVFSLAEGEDAAPQLHTRNESRPMYSPLLDLPIDLNQVF